MAGEKQTQGKPCGDFAQHYYSKHEHQGDGTKCGAASLAARHAAIAQEFRLSGELQQFDATHDGRPNVQGQSRLGKPVEY